MKIHKNALIELVASRDPHREPICNPFLDTSGDVPVLVSTNGRALVSIPVEADKTEGGFITVEVLKLARKASHKKDTLLLLSRAGQRNDMILLQNGSSLVNRVSDYQFPNWRQVIPGAGRTNVVRVCINPRFLLDIAEAMDSTGGVILEIESEKAPLVIRPHTKGEAIGIPHPLPTAKGVLMPIRLE